MTNQKIQLKQHHFVGLAFSAAMALGAFCCTDVLGLDDMSVETSGMTSSDPCMECAFVGCEDVVNACSFDTECGAFLECIQGCDPTDAACALGCFGGDALDPLAVEAIACICGRCADSCSSYCQGGTGGSGGSGGTAGSGGTSTGGSGGSGGSTGGTGGTGGSAGGTGGAGGGGGQGG